MKARHHPCALLGRAVMLEIVVLSQRRQLHTVAGQVLLAVRVGVGARQVVETVEAVFVSLHGDHAAGRRGRRIARGIHERAVRVIQSCIDVGTEGGVLEPMALVDPVADGTRKVGHVLPVEHRHIVGVHVLRVVVPLLQRDDLIRKALLHQLAHRGGGAIIGHDLDILKVFGVLQTIVVGIAPHEARKRTRGHRQLASVAAIVGFISLLAGAHDVVEGLSRRGVALPHGRLHDLGDG